MNVWPDAQRVSSWGRQFGGLVAARHQRSGATFPALRPALQQYGDEFYSHLNAMRESARKKALERAHAAHYAKFEPEHNRYVKAELMRHEEAKTEAYIAFEEMRQEERGRLERNSLNLDRICLSGSEGRKHWVLRGGWTKVGI
jgi:hypothetical protein